MRLPQISRIHAPRKKLRGKGRFFRRILREADEFRMPAEPDDWRAFWHYHADWKGHGNLSWSYRRVFVTALATVFKTVITTRQALDGPYQAWMFLDGADAGLDATYCHTPNPNEDDFPFKPSSMEWEQQWLERLLNPMLPEITLRAGVYHWQDPDNDSRRSTYVIYSPDYGTPLE